MNILFQTRKPRGYHHVPIYFDENKERVEEAKAEHAKRRGAEKQKISDNRLFARPSRKRGYMAKSGTALLALVLLALIFFMIMTL